MKRYLILYSILVVLLSSRLIAMERVNDNNYDSFSMIEVDAHILPAEGFFKKMWRHFLEKIIPEKKVEPTLGGAPIAMLVVIGSQMATDTHC